MIRKRRKRRISTQLKPNKAIARHLKYDLLDFLKDHLYNNNLTEWRGVCAMDITDAGFNATPNATGQALKTLYNKQKSREDEIKVIGRVKDTKTRTRHVIYRYNIALIKSTE
jgi:hypothetical protein